ncbi:MAG: c-type cytochrome [Thermoanaerobaculia bacterium]
MKTRPVFLCALLFSAVSLNAGEADVVKYRQALMKSMAGYMNAMTSITKGAPFKSDLASHAAAVKELARQMPSMFTAGTSPDKVATDALPEVWTKPAQFKAAAQKLETEAGKMQQLAKTNDMKAIATQLDAMKKACGACHDTFRAKEG